MTHFLSRTALVALVAAATTACASTPAYPTVEGAAPGAGPQPARPSFPVQAQAEPERLPPAEADEMGDPLPADRSTPPAAPLPAPAPVPVQASELPPPAPRPVTPDAAPPPVIRTERAAPTPLPPVPTTVTKVVTLAPGKVVDIDGRPKTYTVKDGQGLDAVARAMGSSRAELAKINNLSEPYRLKPGQVLKGPASRAKAYVVAPGDTLFAIAKRFNVKASVLADENDLTISSAIRPGQKLRLPSGYKDSGPTKKTITTTVDVPAPVAPTPTPVPVRPTPAPTPTPAPSPVQPTPAPTPARPVPVRPTPMPPATTPVKPPVVRPVTPPVSPKPLPPAPKVVPDDRPPVLSDDQITALGRGRFSWPVEGQMLSGYGPKAGGQRNDGVNVGAPAGTPVRAAAAGKVVYSGGDVPGFGVTVLIQHDDGWVTVYGHLARADVRMQQTVRAGEQIGQVGSSGGVSQPQLHFEIRYSPSPKFKAKAIDPALVLPRNR
ncbi:MAG: peptidoglycan DD-metalloendopeptidase family protein [Caulobacter sp.]|nr:peptidoglycan DD-metalloendopeptidase family protein [Caulobacter sp.]